MKRLFKPAYSLLTALLISAFGLIGHASALPIVKQGHTQHSQHTQHAPTSSANCAALCVGVPADKKEEIPVFNKKDDEPQPPYYLQFKSAQTSWFAEKHLVARSVEQPSEIPKYRLCCTIRL